MNDLMKLDDIISLGSALASSGYFKDAREASQAVVKVLAGQELGIGPVASMTGIYIVQGKVTLSANIMASLIKSSDKYNYIVLEHSSTICKIEFTQFNEIVGISEFSIEDAKQAGLQGGDNWKKYPKNMLFARAISNGAKWFCPDLFNGQAVYTPDELDANENQGRLDDLDDQDDFILDNMPVQESQPNNPELATVVNDISIQALVKSMSDAPAVKLQRIQTEIEAGNLNYDGLPLTVADMIEWSK